MVRIGRVARMVFALVLVLALAYFGYVGVEGSHRLVNRHTRNDDCRTPAQLGIAYEAINYDAASDIELAAREPDMMNCSAPGAAPGDELVSSDGVRLAGWYVPAASGVGPAAPTVVVSHGWSDNKSGVLEALPVFNAAYNTIFFDYRNHNQSAGSPTTQGINEQRDLTAVLDWLDSTKGPEVVVLWGQSMGGQASVNVAADDPRVDGLILDSTHSRLAVPLANRIERDGYPFGQIGALATGLGAWIRTGVNVMADDPLSAIDDLGSVPVLIVNGGRDETIPVGDAEELYRAALAAGVDARLEVCEEAGHVTLIDTCPDDYRRWVDEFLTRVVDSPGPNS